MIRIIRSISLSLYFLLAGFLCGRGHWMGLVMFVLAAIAMVIWYAPFFSVGTANPRGTKVYFTVEELRNLEGATHDWNGGNE